MKSTNMSGDLFVWAWRDWQCGWAAQVYQDVPRWAHDRDCFLSWHWIAGKHARVIVGSTTCTFTREEAIKIATAIVYRKTVTFRVDLSALEARLDSL